MAISRKSAGGKATKVNVKSSKNGKKSLKKVESGDEGEEEMEQVEDGSDAGDENDTDDEINQYMQDDEFVDDEEEEKVTKSDALASSIASILGQTTGTKAPVLAGRKTALMKAAEKEKKEKRAIFAKREERRSRLLQKMAPSSTAGAVDFERQLKKLATKGVVALFNAVAKTKREAAAAEEADKNAGVERKNTAVAEIDELATSIAKADNRRKRAAAKADAPSGDAPAAKKAAWGVLAEDSKVDTIKMGWDQQGFESD